MNVNKLIRVFKDKFGELSSESNFNEIVLRQDITMRDIETFFRDYFDDGISEDDAMERNHIKENADFKELEDRNLERMENNFGLAGNFN